MGHSPKKGQLDSLALLGGQRSHRDPDPAGFLVGKDLGLGRFSRRFGIERDFDGMQRFMALAGTEPVDGAGSGHQYEPSEYGTALIAVGTGISPGAPVAVVQCLFG